MNVYRIPHNSFSSDSLHNFLLQFLFIKVFYYKMQIWCFSVGQNGKKIPLKAILDDLEWKK